jgi:phage/plasmid primase-like uncharacterized protein
VEVLQSTTLSLSKSFALKDQVGRGEWFCSSTTKGDSSRICCRGKTDRTRLIDHVQARFHKSTKPQPRVTSR